MAITPRLPAVAAAAAKGRALTGWQVAAIAAEQCAAACCCCWHSKPCQLQTLGLLQQLLQKVRHKPLQQCWHIWSWCDAGAGLGNAGTSDRSTVSAKEGGGAGFHADGAPGRLLLCWNISRAHYS
eukprot:CAMPEP_0202894350 /NCGR_PEP_ID=MMETSP1392-20130828/3774_1 /ASSEMBLY_ACC=CAM_ASM_000868 /TAXON_ID=225041 /ORGANISM="Chlamydomonas chlamydogama, Strain SAG 11-48b" /LENGTH=124 /DNA_ID=CAMNT_0049579019 /DNA_START=124 /DNA_END=502 /DNA_ORIENTATION=-